MPKLGVGRVEYRSASSDWVVPIEVDTAGAPAGDLIVAITDLPQGARLNRGKPTADGSWFIEPDETAGLTLRLPDTAEADRLSIALVTGMGRPLARATPRIEPRSEPRPEPKPSSATEREARPDAQQAEPTSSPFGKNRVEDIARVLFERGEARLAEGDVIGARMFFTKAAAEGDAQAAIAIGATYDPSLFQSLEVRGMKPDLQMARHWYRRAIELGSKDAYERLERLADK